MSVEHIVSPPHTVLNEGADSNENANSLIAVLYSSLVNVRGRHDQDPIL